MKEELKYLPKIVSGKEYVSRKREQRQASLQARRFVKHLALTTDLMLCASALAGRTVGSFVHRKYKWYRYSVQIAKNVVHGH